MCEADRQVSEREQRNREKPLKGGQIICNSACLPTTMLKRLTSTSAIDARFPNGSHLTPSQKRAHATLLIQAGADTTGTALESTPRFMMLDEKILERAHEEIYAADQAGHLTSPIQFEELANISHFSWLVFKKASV